MPSMSDVFAGWKIGEGEIAAIMALGILSERAMNWKISDKMSFHIFLARSAAVIKANIGKKLPGTNEVFSQEMAETLIEYLNSDKGAALLEWSLSLHIPQVAI